jgi:hypothetical protein
MNERTVPRRRPEAVSRNVEGQEVVVLPLIGEIQVLNAVGARIWSLIDGKRSVDEIARTIESEFTVDEPTARADTLKFLGTLRDRDLLVEG